MDSYSEIFIQKFYRTHTRCLVFIQRFWSIEACAGPSLAVVWDCSLPHKAKEIVVCWGDRVVFSSEKASYIDGLGVFQE